MQTAIVVSGIQYIGSSLGDVPRRVSVLIAAGALFFGGSAAADELLRLKVENLTNRTITVRVSAKNPAKGTRPNEYSIGPRKSKVIELASPDKFNVTVKRSGFSYKARPMALRTARESDADHVLRVRLLAKGPGDPALRRSVEPTTGDEGPVTDDPDLDQILDPEE